MSSVAPVPRWRLVFLRPGTHMAAERDLLAGRCLQPKNPKPNVTTYFCVYPKGHDGSHSWQETAEARAERMKREGWS